MSNDVLITPASRKIEFKDSSANVDAKIETDASGNLLITNAGGDISIGDTSSDVFIGDGTNNVDIVFEQDGEIRGTSGVTLTLGASGSSVAMATDLSLGGNDLTNVGDITVSGNLTVNGTTTTLDSTNTVIEDSIIELNSGLTGANTKDIGFIFERGSTGNNAGFVWDESADRFTVFTTTDTAASDTVNTSSVANFQAGSFYGNGANLTSLNATNISSGTLANARLPDLTVSDFAGAAIQTGSESFSDSDTILMTAAAVQDKILSYGYTTNVGDVTSVSASSPLSVGGGGGPSPNISFVSATITTSTSDADGDFFLVHSGTTSSGGLFKLTKANINLSGFNNDSGFLTSSSGLNASNLTSGTVPSARLATGSSGDWWSGNVIKVGTDGVSEVGKYIDFHNTDTGTTDFDTRLYSSGTDQLTINGSGRIFTDGYHPNADAWTTSRTITLAGDLTGNVSISGSANVTLTAAVVDDSHNHNHSDGNFTVNGLLQAGAGSNHISTATDPFRWQRSSSGQTGQDDNVSVYVDDSNIYFTHNNDDDGDASGYLFRYMTGGTATNLLVFSSSTMTYKGNTVFHDAYHPNADKWTTSRTLTLSGDVSGSVSFDGSGAINMTNTAVADDSHNHVISNIDGLQTALDAKPDILTSGYNGTYNIPIHSGGDLYTSPTAGGVTITGSSGQISTPSHGNSSQWNTAYGWGNHASAGYLTASSTQSKYLRSDAADTATGQLFFDAGFDAHPIMLSGAQNFDNIDRSGFYNLYNTHNGSTNSPGFSYGTMIAIGNDKGSTGFGLQIAHERTGAGMYVRGMNDTASAWSAWAEIWTSTTDGSGSGLDADTLDGQHGSYYAPTANPTFTGTITNAGTITTGSAQHQMNTPYGYIEIGPKNTTWGHIYTDRANFYFNKQLYVLGDKVWNAGNDGSGSGLDADTLDGINSASFARSDTVTNYSNYVNVQRFYSNTNMATASGTQSSLEVYTGASGNDAFMSFHVNGDYATYFGLDGGTNKLSTGGWSAGATSNTVWHAGVDGSGSGLDADTLDGIQGSKFLSEDGNGTGDFRYNPGGSSAEVLLGHEITSNTGSSFIKCVKQNFTGIPGSIRFYISPANTTNANSSTYLKHEFQADGDFHADGDVIAYSTTTGSDRKLKKNIRDLEGSLDKTLKLRGVKFDWKDENKANDQLGFIAQEVEEVLPEVVKEVKTLAKEGETHLTVNYPAVVPVLVEAIKEQQSIINRLEERLSDLENKLK